MKRHFFLTLLLSFLLVCLLAGCGNASLATTDAGNPGVPSGSSDGSSASIQMAIGKFREFALPKTGSGLMRPAVDGQGRVWFGEMSHNLLGSFDSQSGKFWQQTPPNGKAGVMGAVAASDGTLWFAEQYANYIGHYFPTTGMYKVYPLPMISTPDPSNAENTLSLPSAPNDLALDTHGTLWFTEMNANAIGSLNTSTGTLYTYALPATTKAHALNPYGITVDPRGTVWFTEASTSQLGRLDPLTGKVSYFTPPNLTSSLMEVAGDPQGGIWATTFETGQLVHFDPIHGHFTTYTIPASDGNAGALYGVAVAPNGDVWVAVSSQNMLARLDQHTQHFVYYTIPTPNSQPLGLAVGPRDTIWFTEANTDKIGVLQP